MYKPETVENSISEDEDESSQARDFGDTEDEDRDDMSSDQMEQELDRIEEEDNAEPHPEYEPIPEEQGRDNPRSGEGDDPDKKQDK